MAAEPRAPRDASTRSWTLVVATPSGACASWALRWLFVQTDSALRPPGAIFFNGPQPPRANGLVQRALKHSQLLADLGNSKPLIQLPLGIHQTLRCQAMSATLWHRLEECLRPVFPETFRVAFDRAQRHPKRPGYLTMTGSAIDDELRREQSKARQILLAMGKHWQMSVQVNDLIGFALERQLRSDSGGSFRK